jgi:hypothetical protein
MANYGEIGAALTAIRNGLAQLESSLAALRADAEVGRRVREITKKGTAAPPLRPSPSSKGPKLVKRGKRTKPPRASASASASSGRVVTKILEVLRDQKEGALSRDIANVVGVKGDALWAILKRLRDEKKIDKRGTTSQTRYFLTAR